jgi:hypothetical protein
MCDIEGKESGFSALACETHSVVEPPTLLQFTLSSDVQGGIATAKANFKTLSANVDQHVLDFKHFGKNVIKVRCFPRRHPCFLGGPPRL